MIFLSYTQVSDTVTNLASVGSFLSNVQMRNSFSSVRNTLKSTSREGKEVQGEFRVLEVNKWEQSGPRLPASGTRRGSWEEHRVPEGASAWMTAAAEPEVSLQAASGTGSDSGSHGQPVEVHEERRVMWPFWLTEQQMVCRVLDHL